RALPPGRIGFSSQSGALGLALLEKAAERQLGFSAFVSIGNKADVSSNDLLEWWEDDEASDVVLLYLESFGNPRKFARMAKRVARHKPILALKAGTTGAGQRAASSHTAALTGSEAAADALLLADPGVDSVIALFVPPVVATAEDVATAIDRACQGATKPVLAVVVSADGIPTALRRPDAAVAAFAYPESAARALGLAVARS